MSLSLKTSQTEVVPESVFPSAGRPHFEGRPTVRGKFFFLGHRKLYVRGVTYGTFRPDENGCEYPTPETVARDFALMTAHGINTVRTYTVPPRWLLDLAQSFGLYLLVGLPWEQHVAFLDHPQRLRAIETRVRASVRACAAHPAILGYAIGNEIPAPIARWHGRRRLERFLKRLYQAAKTEDPGALVTYVNYPSTEYLRLPFLDFVCFNVYLETQKALDGYLARLHHLAGDHPLVMAEIGLDSRRHGQAAQARTLDWQIRTCMAAGCAGTFVFSWTDEWHRGGLDIDDWDFGLTLRNRQPKPALTAVREAFAETPFAPDQRWPRISVVLCTYNGSRTIAETLQALSKLQYPDYEVIVVNDGSTDHTPTIVQEFECLLINTGNRGLSSARNTGLSVATGEIVAYLDDDAYPDPDWLTYLAASFTASSHAGIGGPNIAPPHDEPLAQSVANAPGGPIHVMLSDREAEHIPGCNMAFRKTCLEAIGGFDPQFRVAGDDVDLCWRIQRQGWTLGFSPAAVVWHHRRNSIGNFWRQQKGYGKAEALLERKWPEKYNSAGHVRWTGQLYGKGLTRVLGRIGRIYHGVWGSAPFQSLHQTTPGLLSVLPTVPEWYLVVIALAGLSTLGLFWPKLLLALPLFLAAAGASLLQAAWSAAQASFPNASRSGRGLLQRYALTGLLHLVQPLARLCGRVRHGLTAWRLPLPHSLSLPWPRTLNLWSERWQSPEAHLQSLETTLRKQGAVVMRGTDYDRWDIEIRGGILGAARLLMTVEEHGQGKQYFRFRLWPRYLKEGLVAIAILAGLAAAAFLDHAWGVGMILSLLAGLLSCRALQTCAYAMAAVQRSLRIRPSLTPQEQSQPWTGQ